jgi:hypothetical protein
MRRALLLLSLWASPALALEDEGQIWLNWQASGVLKGRLLGHFDTSIRLEDDPRRVGQVVFRAGLGWRIRNEFSVQGGWFYTNAWPLPGVDQREHRSYQQANYTIGSGHNFSLRARTRLEERFRLGRDGMGLRVRQQVRLTVDPGLPGGIRPFVAPEVFVTAVEAPSWGPRTGLEQVRNVTGLAVPLSRQNSLEIGHLLFWRLQDDALIQAVHLTLATRF